MRMDIKEKLLQELKNACKGTELDFERISGGLSEFIGHGEVVDYYIAQAPLPDFPDTILNIMVLSGKCLYDYEARQNRQSLRHVLLLSEIVTIEERFTGEGDEFLRVDFSPAGLGGGLVTESKLSESGNLRRFSSGVIKKMVENI